MSVIATKQYAPVLLIVWAFLSPVCLGQNTSSSALSGETIELGRGTGARFTACASNFEPLVKCKADQNPLEYSGYQVELFRETAPKLGIGNYTIACLPFQDVLTDLVAGGAECDIGIGAITLTSERTASGLHFTFPTYRGSLGVLVRGKVGKGSTWSFFKPLHWNLWLALAVTSAVVPVVIFVMESLACHGFIHRKDWGRGLRQTLWDSLLTMLHFGNFTVHSQEARIIVIGYGFMSLIIMNTYVANLAAFLTITTIEGTVKSVQDLVGKRVATGGVYESRLLSSRIQVGYTFDSAEKESSLDVLRARNGTDAIIYDEPWVTNIASTTGCDLLALTETFSPFDYAFVLPARSEELEEAFSRELVILQEDGTMSRLIEEQVHFESSRCPLDSELSETESMRFSQMIGLWIILAGAVLISAAVLFSKGIRNARMNSGTIIGNLVGQETIVRTEYHPYAIESRLGTTGKGSRDIPESMCLETLEFIMNEFRRTTDRQLEELRAEIRSLNNGRTISQSPRDTAWGS